MSKPNERLEKFVKESTLDADNPVEKALDIAKQLHHMEIVHLHAIIADLKTEIAKLNQEIEDGI